MNTQFVSEYYSRFLSSYIFIEGKAAAGREEYKPLWHLTEHTSAASVSGCETQNHSPQVPRRVVYLHPVHDQQEIVLFDCTNLKYTYEEL
jgi:hypothetical protein